MMSWPDLFPLGIAFEGLAARMAGAGADHDEHQLRDVEIHLATYREHLHGVQEATSRGDIYNTIVENTDAVINLLFAYIVASRILSPEVRTQAFASVREAASSP